MTISGDGIDRLIDRLRVQPGFEDARLAGPPQPLTGGYWASLNLLRLSGVAPPADTLVLRVMPDDVLAAKEAIFQGEIAQQGFPVPAIRLAGGHDLGLGGAFLVMDYARGNPPLACLDGLAALRRLPSLARGLPVLLGQVSARLHALDPGPLGEVLRESDAQAWSGAPEFLARLTETADGLGRSDLLNAARWLADHQPPPTPMAICHGDLHPFNLLVDEGSWTLLDWTTALIADPAYDLAFTALLLRHPPLVAPSALRPVIAGGGALIARRFMTAYRRSGGRTPHPQALRWFTNLHALRAMIEVEGWRQEGALEDHAGHPWMALAPTATRILAETANA